MDFRSQSQPKINKKSIHKSIQQHNSLKANKLKKLLFLQYNRALGHLRVCSKIRVNRSNICYKTPLKSMLQVGLSFGANLAPFWEGFGSQVGTKSLQKSIQTMTEKLIAFRMAFKANFNGFWLPTCLPKGERTMERTLVSGSIFGSWASLGPKTPPRSPKTPPRGLLGAMFGRFWPPTWWILNGFRAQLGGFLVDLVG